MSLQQTAALTYEIWTSTLENKIRNHKRACNILYLHFLDALRIMLLHETFLRCIFNVFHTNCIFYVKLHFFLTKKHFTKYNLEFGHTLL